MTLTLHHIDAGEEPVRATELPLVIGRSCDVQVRVACRWASRRHCEIDHLAGEFILRDLGSRYGTFVNGQAIQQIVLHPGDEIRVGLDRFVVELKSELMSMEHDSVTDFKCDAI